MVWCGVLREVRCGVVREVWCAQGGDSRLFVLEAKPYGQYGEEEEAKADAHHNHLNLPWI